MRKERDVCFEDVLLSLQSGNILDIVPHFNPQKYPNQRLFIISISEYTYYVPFVENDEEIFLKNIIPSRKYHKIYKG